MSLCSCSLRTRFGTLHPKHMCLVAPNTALSNQNPCHRYMTRRSANEILYLDPWHIRLYFEWQGHCANKIHSVDFAAFYSIGQILMPCTQNLLTFHMIIFWWSRKDVYIYISWQTKILYFKIGLSFHLPFIVLLGAKEIRNGSYLFTIVVMGKITLFLLQLWRIGPIDSKIDKFKTWCTIKKLTSE